MSDICIEAFDMEDANAVINESSSKDFITDPSKEEFYDKDKFHSNLEALKKDIDKETDIRKKCSKIEKISGAISFAAGAAWYIRIITNPLGFTIMSLLKYIAAISVALTVKIKTEKKEADSIAELTDDGKAPVKCLDTVIKNMEKTKKAINDKRIDPDDKNAIAERNKCLDAIDGYLAELKKTRSTAAANIKLARTKSFEKQTKHFSENLGDINLDEFIVESELSNDKEIKDTDANELEDKVLSKSEKDAIDHVTKIVKGEEIKGDRAYTFDINSNGWESRVTK